ncbi:MAG: AAA family ATPase [Rhodospirillaceae bacterium]
MKTRKGLKRIARSFVDARELWGIGIMDIPDQQQSVVSFLSNAAAFGLPPAEPVKIIETHVSVIFLAGSRAYKLKKRVKFPYLDFTEAAERQKTCEVEVRMNRRTAPDMYLGVRAVTDEGSGHFALDGAGAAVDWVVEMRRFPEGGLFTDLAAAGKLKRRLMEDLADNIARFHAAAEIERTLWNPARVAAIIDNNDASLNAWVPGVFDGATVARVKDDAHAVCRTLLDLIAARQAAGRARQCHGDLHLANICLWEGQPMPFDVIEFNERLSHIDVLYDLAFLIMDLDYRGHRRLASFVLNRYLDRAPLDGIDVAGLAAMPLFLAMRAAVRAHVSASQGKTKHAKEYLGRANGYLVPAPPRLVAVGGLSGSGKSRLARELAWHFGTSPGARVVRSDVMRKRLAGFDIMARLPSQFYTPDHSARTYAACFDEIRTAIAAGRSAVFDAVQAKPCERAGIEKLARELGVPFTGIWVTAPPEYRLDRVANRQANVSDVTEQVARKQENFDLGQVAWAMVDSSGKKKETIAQGLKTLGLSEGW